MEANTVRYIKYVLILLFLYISWGSVYLGIKFSLAYYPPVLQTAVRMLLAGLCLLGVSYLRKERTKVTWFDIKRNIILAFFLVTISSGFTAIGQQTIPSGTTAMIYGATPIMLLVSGWLFWNEPKPTKKQFVGLILGFSMLLWLNLYQGLEGEASFLGMFWVFLSACGWVYGSYLSKKINTSTPLSLIKSSGVLMVIGGIESFIFAFIIGERFGPEALSLNGIGIILYLTIMSSLIGYTCYLWLLVNARPIVAISYEYVTPVVAVYLGWLLSDESLNSTVIFVCIGLVVSIVLVLSKNRDHG